MEDYRLVGRCIHAVTSEYGFKLAVGVNTVLHALAAGKVKRGKVILPSETDYGVAQLVIHLFRLCGTLGVKDSFLRLGSNMRFTYSWQSGDMSFAFST